MRKMDGVLARLAASAVLQYRVVSIDANGKVAYPTASSLPLGVTLGSASIGDSVDVQYSEIAEIEVGTAGVALDSFVKAGTDGRIVTASTTGDKIIGLPLESGVVGDIIPVLLTRAKV